MRSAQCIFFGRRKEEEERRKDALVLRTIFVVEP